MFPLSWFWLYDDLVIVEPIVGDQQLAEADDVAGYEKYLELLRDAANTGTEAAAVIRRSLESLRAVVAGRGWARNASTAAPRVRCPPVIAVTVPPRAGVPAIPPPPSRDYHRESVPSALSRLAGPGRRERTRSSCQRVREPAVPYAGMP